MEKAIELRTAGPTPSEPSPFYIFSHGLSDARNEQMYAGQVCLTTESFSGAMPVDG